MARMICAHGAGIACALSASISWGQQPPPPADPAPAEPGTPPAGEAPPAGPVEPGSAAPGAGTAAPDPGGQTPEVVGDSPSADTMDDAQFEIEEVGAATVGADGKVDEVVITVDRRRKNLQDYSGTAAAFSESQLRNIGISNVASLQTVVPGVQIGNDNNGATIYIRGVGSDNTTELGDPAVAVHLDNVYLPRFRGLNAAWLDVERVEVNSGPQGTVRGRNAVGGSVNIISKPAVLGEHQAMAEVTFGTFRQRSYQGMVNIPFGDHVALRAAAMSTQIDHTWQNAGPVDHLPGAQDTNDYAAKGQLRWQPSQRLNVVLAGDYTLQRGAGYVGANVINLINREDDNGTPLDQTDDTPNPVDPNTIDNPRYVFQRGRYPWTWSEHWGTRLNATYDTGPVSIELLASYRFLDWETESSSTAGYFFPGDPNLRNQQWDAWSFASQQNNDSESGVVELRFASPDDQRLVWSLGLFGFYEDQGAFLGQITGDPDGGFNEFNMPSTIGYSYAAYGDVTFKVTEAFRLMAGLRASVEHKDRLGGIWMIGSDLPQEGNQLCARQNTAGECVEFGLASNDIGRYGTEGFQYRGLDRKNYTAPDANSTKEERVNFYLDGIESFGVRDQTAIALCNDVAPEFTTELNGPSNINNPGRLVQDENGNWRCANGVRASVPDNILNVRPQNGERDDKYFDFRVGLEYDLTAQNLLYATLSSGHKAGGFNDSIPNPDAPGGFQTPDYGPETAYALEIGAKNEFLDRRLRVNGSAFAFVYDGLQFQTIVTVGEPPPLNPDGTVQIDPVTRMPFPDNRSGSAARQNAQNTATAYGLDLDIIYALPFGLEADLHGLLMDARFPDNTYVLDGRLGLNDAPAQVDIGGYWLPRVSPYTLNYSVSQLIHTAAGSFDWIIQGQTRGEHYMTPFNGNGKRLAPRGPGWGVDVDGTPAPIEVDNNQNYANFVNNPWRLDDRVPVYSVFNFGVGWRRPDGMLSIRGFVNNVFNIAYANTIIQQGNNNIRFYNDPRMAGIRVRMDF